MARNANFLASKIMSCLQSVAYTANPCVFFTLIGDEDAAQRLGQGCELNVSTASRMVSYWLMLFHPVIAVFNA